MIISETESKGGHDFPKLPIDIRRLILQYRDAIVLVTYTDIAQRYLVYVEIVLVNLDWNEFLLRLQILTFYIRILFWCFRNTHHSVIFNSWFEMSKSWSKISRNGGYPMLKICFAKHAKIQIYTYAFGYLSILNVRKTLLKRLHYVGLCHLSSKTLFSQGYLKISAEWLMGLSCQCSE